jgi:4-amino-4-deoxy-L-arabinose transferase-like glycosyltransferase
MRPRAAIWSLVGLAAASIVAHFFIGNGYGFHRDELATLDDARHLDWGYVAYPPVTPFFGRISLAMFGTSLVGFRIFAALASAVSIILTGLMAREFGGGRTAQLVAAISAVPFCLAAGGLMQYVAFDYLFWTLVAYCFLRLLNSADPRWWVAIGSAIGLGMLTKYTMMFLVAGLVVAVLTTRLRLYLKSKWLWLGAGCAILIFLPNLCWQIRHHLISLDFLHHIHERDVRIGRTKGFLPDQLLLTLFALPIAVIGLWFCLGDRHGRRFRAMVWLYLIPLVLFLVAQGRGYYLAPAYSILYAAGGAGVERYLSALSRGWSMAVGSLIGLALTLNVALSAAVNLPIAPINSKWWAFASKNNGDLVEEIGWPDLVNAIAKVRDDLPPEERERVAVWAGNYGEAGAINLYGPAHGLPPVICGTNSFWSRTTQDALPDTVIVVGFPTEFVQAHFSSATLMAPMPKPYAVANEETTSYPGIFVCHQFRGDWREFWKKFQRYG